MFSLIRSLRLVRSTLPPQGNHRLIGISSQMNQKIIKTEKVGEDIIISSDIVDSERKPYLLKNPFGKSVCPLCATNVNVKHTDVLILSQFVRQNGTMMPRAITGLCIQQQRRISAMVTMAKKAGLMPNLSHPWSHKDPKKRDYWKRYNIYFNDRLTEKVGGPNKTKYFQKRYRPNPYPIS